LQKAVYDAWEAESWTAERLGDPRRAHVHRDEEYVALEGRKGTYGNSDGTENDDTVMAMAIVYRHVV
jgi:hypothetical protein